MPDIAIRAESPGDIEAIRSLVTAAFGQSDEADLVDRLRADGDAAMSMVAAAGGEIVGHVLLSPMDAPFPALALAPLSVAPQRQRQGIGSRLTRAALAWARRNAWTAIFVVGAPAYYCRFGFRADLAAGFDSPYAGPYMMVLPLEGPLDSGTGKIVHAPAFATLT